LWQRGLVEGRLCGCGSPVPACATWTSILGRAFDGRADVTPARMAGLFAGLERPRDVAKLMRGAPQSDKALSEAASVLSRLYTSIRDETGAAVIVDSSKPPT